MLIPIYPTGMFSYPKAICLGALFEEGANALTSGRDMSISKFAYTL